MNKILDMLKEFWKDKQLVGIVLILISIVSFIVLSLIHHIYISIMVLIVFSIGVYLLLKYSTKK